MSSKSKLIAVLVAGGVLAVVVVLIAYQMMSGPTRREIKLDAAQVAKQQEADDGSGRAPAVPPKPESEWMPKFRETYALADGESIRLAPKPFIAERIEFYRARMHAAQVQAIPRGPDFYLLDYDGTDFKMRTAWFGQPGVRSLFSAVLGIEATRLMGPDAILEQVMTGDIVLKKGSGIEQNRGPFVKLLGDAFGRKLSLEQQTLERDVVVVSGKLKLRTPTSAPTTVTPASTQETARRRRMGLPDGPALKLFIGKPQGGGWTQTGGPHMAREFENICRLPVIVEGDIGGQNVPIEMDPSIHQLYRRGNQPPDSALLDELLKNISDQSELTFKREKRPVETWVLTDLGPTTAPASGGASTLPAGRRALP